MCKGIHYLIISNDKRGGKQYKFLSTGQLLKKKKKKHFYVMKCYAMGGMRDLYVCT